LALLLEPSTSPHLPISPEEAQEARVTGEWGNDPALKIVIQDAVRAENYASSKAWIAGWASASTLLQSPYMALYWEGTSVPRANVPLFTVATAVNSVVPQIVSGLFYENPPFIVQPKPSTSAEAARAVGEILQFQLEDIGFKHSLKLGITNAVLYGTTIWKWGWETFTKTRKVYERTDKSVSLPSGVPGASDITIDPEEEEIVERTIEEYVDRPFFDHVTNLRHVLVDPTLDLPDIRKGKYVIHRMYVTYDDLIKMKERPGFKIPSDKDLLNLFMPPREMAESAMNEDVNKNPLWDMRAESRWKDATVDPFEEPLELLERWDNDKYIVVLQKKLVICNMDNPYGIIPFFSVNWWDVPEAFWGMGLGKLVGAEQRLQQGILNTWLDNAALNLQGVFTRKRGKSVPTQSIRIAPGRIIDVEDKDDFVPMQRTPAVPEAGQHLALSQARVEQTSGANELSSQGIAGSSGHSNIARTAAGANLLASGSGNRISDFVEKLADNVIIPFLYQVHEMDRSRLPVKTIKSLLNDELQSDYFKNKGDIVELLNSRLKFSILAGAKMAVRRNLAQALPVLSSFLTNQFVLQQLQTEQKKIDVEELLHLFFEAAEMPDEYYDIVVPMTPEESQRAQQNSPAALVQAKAQAAQQSQQAITQQKFQQQQMLLDQGNYAKSARDILRHSIETAGLTEAIQGEPGAQGFGGNNFG
jgi:hypothetical protein